jgi:hypothetical protein
LEEEKQMGDGVIIRRSHAKKCFVCGRNLEDLKRKNDDGTVTLCAQRHMGDPGKYERLCLECNEKENEKAREIWEEHLLELGVKQ